MTESNSTIFFAGGGSGGHLYPGVAVAQALRKHLPNVRPIFLCTDRPIDALILKDTGFEFVPQPICPPRRTVGGLIRFWRAWRATQDQVRKLIIDLKPSAVLGLGGYAAGVAVKLAAGVKVPVAILNPDVIPGKANQYLFAKVDRICCQYKESVPHIPKAAQSKVRLTGCPIRQDILDFPRREEALSRLGLDPLLRTLVVTGASQGAVTVNQAVVEALRGMAAAREGLQGWQILHLAGPDHAEEVRKEYRELHAGLPGEEAMAVRVVDFTPDMRDVWAAADLAVARSGASTCAELTACGIPAILMPYPFHSDMHQLANAKVLEAAGGAVIVSDKRDRRATGQLLMPALEKLLYDGDRRQRMKDILASLAVPQAAENVAQVLLELIQFRSDFTKTTGA